MVRLNMPAANRSTAFQSNALDLGDRQGIVVFALQHPAIALVDGFLSPEECEALVALSAARLAPASVLDQTSGILEVSSFRTSWHAKLERAENPLVERIEARTALLAGLPDGHGERIEIIRYQVGQQYRPHCDWFDPGTPGGKARIEQRGQRVATILMYLSDVDEGGSTVFPMLGLDVRPRKGAALYFSNVNAQGLPEPLTRHAGTPVAVGQKLVATRWFSSQFQADA